MKKSLRFLAIVALAALIGFSLAACKNGSNGSATYWGVTIQIYDDDYSRIMSGLGLSANINDLENFSKKDAREAIYELMDAGYGSAPFLEATISEIR